MGLRKYKYLRTAGLFFDTMNSESASRNPSFIDESVRPVPSRELPRRILLFALKNPHPPGLLGQFSTEIRVRNANQLQRALLHGLAPQLRHAVLGDNVVDVVLAGGDVGAGREGIRWVANLYLLIEVDVKQQMDERRIFSLRLKFFLHKSVSMNNAFHPTI